jgi:hypothetical protein
MVPLVVGTIIASTYGYLRTATRMSWEAKHELLHVLKIYNSISWPVGTGLAIVLGYPLVRGWERRRAGKMASSPESLRRLRRQVLRLPFWLAFVNCLTWFPSVLVFAVAATRIAGRFSLPAFLHFATSILFSWFVATTYATLFVIYFSVRVLYPDLLVAQPGMRQEARGELRFIRAVSRALPAFAAFIPLAAAFLLVALGPGELRPMRPFQLLMVGFITAGGAGLMLAVRVTERLDRIYRALTGECEAGLHTAALR